jgi:hypothetical protein
MMEILQVAFLAAGAVAFGCYIVTVMVSAVNRLRERMGR